MSRRPKPEGELTHAPGECARCDALTAAQEELTRAREAAAWGAHQRALADAAERGRMFRDNLWAWIQTEMPNTSRRP